MTIYSRIDRGYYTITWVWDYKMSRLTVQPYSGLPWSELDNELLYLNEQQEVW